MENQRQLWHNSYLVLIKKTFSAKHFAVFASDGSFSSFVHPCICSSLVLGSTANLANQKNTQRTNRDTTKIFKSRIFIKTLQMIIFEIFICLKWSAIGTWNFIWNGAISWNYVARFRFHQKLYWVWIVKFSIELVWIAMYMPTWWMFLVGTTKSNLVHRFWSTLKINKIRSHFVVDPHSNWICWCVIFRWCFSSDCFHFASKR